jgi:hypothetical protein
MDRGRKRAQARTGRQRNPGYRPRAGSAAHPLPAKIEFICNSACQIPGICWAAITFALVEDFVPPPDYAITAAAIEVGDACTISLITKDVVEDSTAAVHELNLFSVEVWVGNGSFLLVLGSDLSLTGAEGSPYIEVALNIASTLDLSFPSSVGVLVAVAVTIGNILPITCTYCGTMVVRIQVWLSGHKAEPIVL